MPGAKVRPRTTAWAKASAPCTWISDLNYVMNTSWLVRLIAYSIPFMYQIGRQTSRHRTLRVILRHHGHGWGGTKPRIFGVCPWLRRAGWEFPSFGEEICSWRRRVMMRWCEDAKWSGSFDLVEFLYNQQGIWEKALSINNTFSSLFTKTTKHFK